MTYIHTQHLLILFGKPYDDQLRRQLIVFFSSLFGNGSLVLLEIFDGIVVVAASKFLIVTIREPSIATQTKPIPTNTTRGVVDPKFELSKKFPTVGYLTKPVNFTVTVIAPMTISEQFKDFWGTYGQFIGLFAGGFVGAYAKVIFDKRKKRHEKEH